MGGKKLLRVIGPVSSNDRENSRAFCGDELMQSIGVMNAGDVLFCTIFVPGNIALCVCVYTHSFGEKFH